MRQNYSFNIMIYKLLIFQIDSFFVKYFIEFYILYVNINMVILILMYALNWRNVHIIKKLSGGSNIGKENYCIRCNRF